MKTLGNIFILVGVLFCLTIVGALWGVPLVVAGGILRLSAKGT